MMQATQEQLKALTFPALPEVVQRGTPVLWCSKAFLSPEPGVIIMGRDLCLVGIDSTTGYVRRGDLLVDLTDATGRAHLVWSIGKVGDAFDVTRDARQSGLVKVWIGGKVVFVSRQTGLHPKATVVPKLRPLSHEASVWSPVALPDGTPWFKAEALRLVALHRFGTGEVPAGPEKSPGGA